MKYYQLEPVFSEGHWVLSDPYDHSGKWVSPDTFTSGIPWHEEKGLRIRVYRQGMPYSFTLGPQSMPVVKDRIAEVVANRFKSEVQAIPTAVGDVEQGFSILNVLQVFDCFDEVRTEAFSRYEPADGKEDSVGSLKDYVGLRVAANRTRDKNVFWVKGTMALVISDALRTALEELEATGISYRDVT